MEIKPKSGDWNSFKNVIDVYERRVEEAKKLADELSRKAGEARDEQCRLEEILNDLRRSAPKPEGPYADMKTVDAIEAVLRNGPKVAAAIADELLEGGFQTKAQDFRNVIIVTLNQNKAPDGPFRKTNGDNEWRLDQSQEIEMPLLKAGDDSD